MAIFQPTFQRKTPIDDTQHITITIETSQKINDHTEYILKVQRGPNKENFWKLSRRYNDFVELHKCLNISGIELPFPEKKYFGNMQPEFIAKRRFQLQEYLNAILMNPILASSLPAKKFVDPESYNQSFHDISVQNAVLCLKTENQYVLGPSLGMIGWRLRKHYFRTTLRLPGAKSAQTGKHQLVKSGSQPQAKQQQLQSTSSAFNGSLEIPNNSSSSSSNELVLSWTEFGPDRYICDKEIHNCFKYISELHHPFIEPLVYATSNDSGALIIRKFYAQGTLKDVLCGSSPKNPFLGKYGNPKGRAPLPLKEVAMYGRQILEALRFLHSKGHPFGHIHAGNVIITDGSARLLDIENFVLGVPSFYRPFFVQHSKISTAENVDVYSFGHLMYEMSMGYPLQESVTRQPIECSESLKNLLESILSKEACQKQLPTLDTLIDHRFFAEHAPRFSEQYSALTASNRPHFKLSAAAKEQMKIATQKIEQRLQNEQKSVKHQKRLVRVQEMMTSEEEKKKIKHKAHKLEHKQSKLRQQNSLQLCNAAAVSIVTPLPKSDSVHSISTTQGGLLSPPPNTSTTNGA
ncbi:PX domain-containing protein kinase-like protein, partial [Pseudolycoriella hygida]